MQIKSELEGFRVRSEPPRLPKYTWGFVAFEFTIVKNNTKQIPTLSRISRTGLTKNPVCVRIRVSQAKLKYIERQFCGFRSKMKNQVQVKIIVEKSLLFKFKC